MIQRTTHQIVLAFSLILFRGIADAQAVSYSRLDIPTGIAAIKVVVADFNRDGKNDIAYLLSGNGAQIVAVLLGKGNGSFQAAKTTILGAAGRNLATGDVNDDEIPDLITDEINNRVYVLLGRGDGTFQAPQMFRASPPAFGIGDFNGDGKADLAAVGSDGTGANVGVYAGNGDGTFVQTVFTPTGSSQAVGLAVADFNRDGKMDVATANLSGNVSVLIGKGDGTFLQPTVYALGSGSQPRALAVGDMNGDSVLDIVACGTRTIVVLLGNGDGTFGGSWAFNMSRNSHDVAITDLNVDGLLDVIVATSDFSPSSSFATVLLGTGNGMLGTPQDFPATCCSSSIAVARLNGDILPDLVVAGTAATSISVLLTGGLPPPTPILSVSNGPKTFFTQGQQGATMTYIVSNSNAPNTRATSGTVTFTQTVPTVLQLTSMSGQGWTCSQNQCSRADALSPGASYPPITVTVNVQTTAPPLVTNIVAVSGGGSDSFERSDTLNVNASTCTFSIFVPTSSFDSGGGSGGNSVNTSNDCSWSPASNASWLIIYPLVGNGSGFVTGSGGFGYNVNQNLGANRVGTMMVQGEPFTVSQAGREARSGIFRSGFFWLQDITGVPPFSVPPGRAFAFGGVPGDIPITGDWDGSGPTKVGVYRPSNGLFILDYDGDGQFTLADKVYKLGVGMQPDDVPVVGDWNGDGRTKIGIFRSGFFWILDKNGSGTFEPNTDQTFAFGGVAGDIPIVGDWNGDGRSKLGLFRSGFYWILDANGNGMLDNPNQSGGDQAFPFGGVPGDVPVVGDWDASGTSKVGVFRLGFFWILDRNGNRQFDGTGVGQDTAYPFGGLPGDKPVVGKW